MIEVSLVRNDRNLGFASSVNAALRDIRRDVVLLNTDTMVFHDWIDRMSVVAATHPRVATVTPLSNAATILSYPTFPQEYKGTLELDWERADGICAAAGASPVEIPTGIGFCMLIKRACLDDIGLFDDVAFRDGYGEESDFCRRAAAGGWLNLAAPDVFVWHRGEGSFGTRAVALRERAQITLQRKHPGYAKLVADFINRDPLRDARRRLDVGRMKHDVRPGRLHLGGGRAPDLDQERKHIYFSRAGARLGHWHPVVEGFGPLPNLQPLSVFSKRQAIHRFLDEADVRELVSYGRAPSLLAARVRAVARAQGLVIHQAAATSDDR